MRRITAMLACIILMLALNGCGKQAVSTAQEENMNYQSITMEEAKKRFEQDGTYLIVDVRREDEFAAGHIPNAVNIPNETIGNTSPSELPDKEQTIYVYCRSGNRSKQASEKLSALGYEHIVEFGGILDWTGEIE